MRSDMYGSIAILALLIKQSETPQWEYVSIGVFHVVTNYIGVFYILDLLMTLLCATYLEGVFADGKVGNFGGDDILCEASLIIEECFPHIANVGIVA